MPADSPAAAAEDAGPTRVFVRMGDDPFGRGEPAVFYRWTHRPEWGECYVWLSNLNAADLAEFGPPSPIDL